MFFLLFFFCLSRLKRDLLRTKKEGEGQALRKKKEGEGQAEAEATINEEMNVL